MKRKDIIISFVVSIAATAIYDAARKLMPVNKNQYCNILFFAVILLTCMYGMSRFSLHRFKVIMEKINIHGKEYYDIFEDINYYQVHKPRNKMKIDKLEWKLNFTPSAEYDMYLDMSAEWVIFFTANQERIRKINVGIRGGDRVSEESMNIRAYQNGVGANCQFEREQDDCIYLNVNLNTDVVKKDNSILALKYQWEKFMLIDRKDDYVYLFPQSLATDMTQFELVTEHPYECTVTVVILKYKWSGEYDKVEVDKTNAPNLKVEISNEENGKKHKIIVNEIKMKNIYIIIFNKSSKQAVK